MFTKPKEASKHHHSTFPLGNVAVVLGDDLPNSGIGCEFHRRGEGKDGVDAYKSPSMDGGDACIERWAG